MDETSNDNIPEQEVNADSTISQTGLLTHQTVESETSPLLDNYKKKEEAVKTLERINIWIGNCDTKVSFALAFAGILIGGFFASNIITDSLQKLINNLLNMERLFQQEDPQLLIVLLTTIFLIGFVVCMGISIFSLFSAIKGNFGSSFYQHPGLTNESNLFFGTIQNKTFLDFKRSFQNQTEESLLNDLLSQVHINSSICKQKFDLYNKGVYFLIFSITAFILLNILFLFIK